MAASRPLDRLTLGTLWLGVTVPFLYYGIQLLAAPFFPDFSFVGVTASELGSDRSPYAAVFNLGIMLLGVVTILTAVGFFRALRRLGTHPVLSWLTALSLVVCGVQTLWAGVFPMPDPRHGGHPLFIANMILLPVLLTVVLWRKTDSWLLKAYFLATLLLLAAMIPIMSGAAGLDTQAYRGLVQRIFTLTIFPPIAVAAYVLARRFRAAAAASPDL